MLLSPEGPCDGQRKRCGRVGLDAFNDFGRVVDRFIVQRQNTISGRDSGNIRRTVLDDRRTPQAAKAAIVKLDGLPISQDSQRQWFARDSPGPIPECVAGDKVSRRRLQVFSSFGSIPAWAATEPSATLNTIGVIAGAIPTWRTISFPNPWSPAEYSLSRGSTPYRRAEFRTESFHLHCGQHTK